MPDYAAADALTQGEVGKDIFKILEKSGVVPWPGENGYREISNPSWLKTPADMKGQNPRGGLTLFLDTFTALCQPDPNELCRRATCAGHRRGGRQENDVDLHRRQAAQLGTQSTS
jgi:hypothetical protein